MTLSREQIEQMPAGPELDELVCTLVLGWRPPDRPDEASDPPPFPIPRDERWDYFNPPSVVEEWRNSYFWRAPNTGCHRRPARVSADISAAWEVLDKLRHQFCCVQIDFDWHYRTRIRIVLDPEHESKVEFEGDGDKTPWVICVAALRAVIQ